MTREEILKQMDKAIREGREQFFKAADAIHFQPKYADKTEELEAIKQQWRDITLLEGYPEIDFPLPLPEWFPEVKIYSRFKADYAKKGDGDNADN